MKTSLIAALMFTPLLAVAQSAPVAKVAGAQPKYQSAFVHYRAFKDEPLGVWREGNEATAKAGGWRVYAREQSQSQSQNANSSGNEAAPHAGHGAAK